MYEQISFKSLVSEGGVDRCVGEAMTYGRKCRNPIAAHNVQAACETIRSLRGTQDQEIIQRLCMELARLCLCVRWHRATQDSSVATTWAREIWEERNRYALSAESTPASSVASSVASTPAQLERGAPNTTPRTSPPCSGENSGLSGSTLRSIESLQAQLLISQRANADLQRENTDRNTLQAQLTVCRREQRQSRHRIQDLEEQVESLQGEAHERNDSNSILREQIVDLTRTLEVRNQELSSEKQELVNLREIFELTTDELDCEKEHSNILEIEVDSEKKKSAELTRTLETTRVDLAAENTRSRSLQAEVDSEKEKSADLKKALETTRTELKEKGAHSHDLQTQLNHEKYLKAAAETKVDLLHTTNTQLEATNQKLHTEQTLHHQQAQKDAEIRATLSTHQTHWTTYSNSWSRFQVFLSKPSCLFTPFKPSTRRALQAQIPWPTPTGTISDISTTTVQIFYLNHLPGLLGPASASRVLALECLICEEEKWRSLIPCYLLRLPGVEAAVGVVRVVVAELVGDVRGEFGGLEIEAEGVTTDGVTAVDDEVVGAGSGVGIPVAETDTETDCGEMLFN